MSPRPTARRAAANRRHPFAPSAAARSAAESRGPRARALLLAAFAAACTAEARQPIAYNHRVHVKDLEIGCETCHATSRNGEVAGIPTLSTCADCHQQANGTSSEEKKVVEAVAAGRDITWARLYELPSHVFFTHRRHVTVAAIACERCHGDMGSQTRPPPRQLVALSMDRCLECHRERGASQDCDACHR